MVRAILTIIACLLTLPASGQTLVDHYRAAMTARGEEDFSTYLAEMEAAIALEPGHPVLQFHLARACANTGEPEHALDWLDRALRQGAWLDIASDPWLEPLHEHSEWAAMVEFASSKGAHLGPGTAGFELEEFDLLPEGIEYDRVTDHFFLGSGKRKIIRVSREGAAIEFISPARDGLLVPLGLRVDEERRRLWAVSAGDPAMGPVEEDEAGTTALHCWSLDDGTLLGRWSPPADTLRHGFNDVALHPDGSVVVTDPGCGALYAARLGENSMLTVLPPESLRGPNGIAISPDGGVAYVAEYVYGVARIDLQEATYSPVAVPENIALIGVDGLYLHGNELVTVQNYAGLDRAAAFELDASGTRVISARVLESRHPRMQDPTTGVIVDDELWYIANSNIAGFNHAEQIPTREEWGTVLILRVPL
jgi:hypothetical protein